MSWTEQDSKTKQTKSITDERQRLLDKVRNESLPLIQKEAQNEATKTFKPIEFQPVRSPEIYEGEFGVKGKDLLFHFWPYGTSINRNEQVGPAFPRGFGLMLERAMNETFDKKFVVIHRDDDVGAWCVSITGFGEKQFFRNLAIQACEKLHKLLGGT